MNWIRFERRKSVFFALVPTEPPFYVDYYWPVKGPTPLNTPKGPFAGLGDLRKAVENEYDTAIREIYPADMVYDIRKGTPRFKIKTTGTVTLLPGNHILARTLHRDKPVTLGPRQWCWESIPFPPEDRPPQETLSELIRAGLRKQ